MNQTAKHDWVAALLFEYHWRVGAGDHAKRITIHCMALSRCATSGSTLAIVVIQQKFTSEAHGMRVWGQL